MDRLLYIEAEYPQYSKACVLLPAAALFLTTDRGTPPSFPLARDLAWPALILTAIGALVCVHHYDLALRRVQARAHRLDKRVHVAPNFCFTSECSGFICQASYERMRLRALFSKGMDWMAVVYGIAVHFRFCFIEECNRTPYQLWLAVLTLRTLSKALGRERLSSATHSLISLSACVFIWTSHVVLLLVGDSCFATIEIFRGPFPARVATPAIVYLSTFLLHPVSQAQVPLKTAIGFLGCLISCYLHTLVRNGAVDISSDNERWGFLQVYLGVSLSAMASFHLSTRLTEVGMTHFLETLPNESQEQWGLSR